MLMDYKSYVRLKKRKPDHLSGPGSSYSSSQHPSCMNILNAVHTPFPTGTS